ncbi:hypothetical protein DIPPA_70124 [Diplonema papillatum]|nr:hypothetical protein DIPPA_70124 [Diplonema papillatum]
MEGGDRHVCHTQSVRSTTSWFEAIGVVRFDIEEGAIVDWVHPMVLSEVEKADICGVSMPDLGVEERSSRRQISTVIFHFETDVCGKHVFGWAMYFQKKVNTVARGALQRSFFILSALPVAGLAHRLLKSVSAFYATVVADSHREEDALLQQALTTLWSEICNWQHPTCCGRAELKSQMMKAVYQCPCFRQRGYTGRSAYISCPPLSKKPDETDWEVVSRESDECLGNDSLRSTSRRPPPLRGSFARHHDRKPSESHPAAAGQALENIADVSHILEKFRLFRKAQHLFSPTRRSSRCDKLGGSAFEVAQLVVNVTQAESAAAGRGSPDVFSFADANAFGSMKRRPDYNTAALVHSLSDASIDQYYGPGEGGARMSPANDKNRLSPLSSAATASLSLGTPNHSPNSGERNSHGRESSCSSSLASPIDSCIGVSSEVKNYMVPKEGDYYQPPGCSSKRHPFFEVRLEKCLAPHLSRLWKLWELLVTGEPILIHSGSAETASYAVRSLTTIIEPLTYVGNVHPYITLHSKNAEVLTTAIQPSTLIGCTNPVFARGFSTLPHVLLINKRHAKKLKDKKIPNESPWTAKHRKPINEDLSHSASPRNELYTKKKFVVQTPSAKPADIKESLQLLTQRFLQPLYQYCNAVIEESEPDIYIGKPWEFFFHLSDRGSDTPASLPVPFSLPNMLEVLSEHLKDSTSNADWKKGRDIRGVYMAFVHSPTGLNWIKELYATRYRSFVMAHSDLPTLLLNFHSRTNRALLLEQIEMQFKHEQASPVKDFQLLSLLTRLYKLVPVFKERLGTQDAA